MDNSAKIFNFERLKKFNKKVKINLIMKVTVVGAGAVGASCAEYIAMKNFASEVVLVDIKEGFAEGKAMDLQQTASLNGFDTKIVGTTVDYSKTAGS